MVQHSSFFLPKQKAPAPFRPLQKKERRGTVWGTSRSPLRFVIFSPNLLKRGASLQELPSLSSGLRHVLRALLSWSRLSIVRLRPPTPRRGGRAPRAVRRRSREPPPPAAPSAPSTPTSSPPSPPTARLSARPLTPSPTRSPWRSSRSRFRAWARRWRPPSPSGAPQPPLERGGLQVECGEVVLGDLALIDQPAQLRRRAHAPTPHHDDLAQLLAPLDQEALRQHVLDRVVVASKELPKWAGQVMVDPGKWRGAWGLGHRARAAAAHPIQHIAHRAGGAPMPASGGSGAPMPAQPALAHLMILTHFSC